MDTPRQFTAHSDTNSTIVQFSNSQFSNTSTHNQPQQEQQSYTQPFNIDPNILNTTTAPMNLNASIHPTSTTPFSSSLPTTSAITQTVNQYIANPAIPQFLDSQGRGVIIKPILNSTKKRGRRSFGGVDIHNGCSNAELLQKGSRFINSLIRIPTPNGSSQSSDVMGNITGEFEGFPAFPNSMSGFSGSGLDSLRYKLTPQQRSRLRHAMMLLAERTPTHGRRASSNNSSMTGTPIRNQRRNSSNPRSGDMASTPGVPKDRKRFTTGSNKPALIPHATQQHLDSFAEMELSGISPIHAKKPCATPTQQHLRKTNRVTNAPVKQRTKQNITTAGLNSTVHSTKTMGNNNNNSTLETTFFSANSKNGLSHHQQMLNEMELDDLESSFFDLTSRPQPTQPPILDYSFTSMDSPFSSRSFHKSHDMSFAPQQQPPRITHLVKKNPTPVIPQPLPQPFSFRVPVADTGGFDDEADDDNVNQFIACFNNNIKRRCSGRSNSSQNANALVSLVPLETPMEVDGLQVDTSYNMVFDTLSHSNTSSTAEFHDRGLMSRTNTPTSPSTPPATTPFTYTSEDGLYALDNIKRYTPTQPPPVLRVMKPRTSFGHQAAQNHDGMVDATPCLSRLSNHASNDDGKSYGFCDDYDNDDDTKFNLDDADDAENSASALGAELGQMTLDTTLNTTMNSTRLGNVNMNGHDTSIHTRQLQPVSFDLNQVNAQTLSGSTCFDDDDDEFPFRYDDDF